MKPIDLGMTYGSPVSVHMESERDEPEKHYPTLHYSGEESLELPSEGVMVVKFHKTASSVSERDGKKEYSCTIEVRKILSVKGAKAEAEDEAPTKSYSKGAEDALDSLMAERMAKKEDY